MRGNEEVQNGQALTEVSFNRNFYSTARRVGHKAAHAGKLTNLVLITACSRFNHHVYRVKVVKGGHQRIKHIFSSLFPDGYNIAVAFLIGSKTAAVLAVNKRYLIFGLLDKHFLFRRHYGVLNAYRYGALCRIIKAQALNAVKHLRSAGRSMSGKAMGNYLSQLGFAH